MERREEAPIVLGKEYRSKGGIGLEHSIVSGSDSLYRIDAVDTSLLKANVHCGIHTDCHRSDALHSP